MAEITVEPLVDHYRVTVVEEDGSSTHEVTVDGVDVERVPGGEDPARLVEASFRFLLDREPKESILRRFDLSVISRYFPEFESRIAEYL